MTQATAPAPAPTNVDGAPSPERPLVKARAVIRDREGRLLVVRLAKERRPQGKAYWRLPGGTVHKGELPEEGADREVHEELGLTHLHAGNLLLTVWSTPRFPQLPPQEQLLFDFGRHDHRALSDLIVPQAEEVSDYAWLGPRAIKRHLYPAQARQLAAIAEGITYLVQGPVPRASNTR